MDLFQEQRDWTPHREELAKKIRSKQNFESALELALQMHTKVHFKSMLPESEIETFWDGIWNGLTDEQLSVQPTSKDNTIVWCLWHITRIEDIVSNILIHEGSQVFDDLWKVALNMSVTDTGNAMNNTEMIAFSQQINKDKLREYSDAVGRRTQEIIRSLDAERLKQKPAPQHLERLVLEGGLIQHKSSIWLKDFWGNKTIAGLVMLPLTHHHVIHLNEAVSMREQILKQQGE